VILSPFHINRKTTSVLGGDFIGLIDGGLLKEYADDMGRRVEGSDITRIDRHQLAACTYQVLPGPANLLRWSVLPSRGHDDLLISTALTVRLDAIDWRDRTARGAGGMTNVEVGSVPEEFVICSPLRDRQRAPSAPSLVWRPVRRV
jgi:hypothetical protein